MERGEPHKNPTDRKKHVNPEQKPGRQFVALSCEPDTQQ